MKMMAKTNGAGIRAGQTSWHSGIEGFEICLEDDFTELFQKWTMNLSTN